MDRFVDISSKQPTEGEIMTIKPWHGVVVASALPFNDDLSGTTAPSPITFGGWPRMGVTESPRTDRSVSTSA